MAIARPIVLVALAATSLALAAPPVSSQNEPISRKDQEFPLDVDLDDRVDPVRPGEEIVFEVEVENFTSTVAPGVVVTIEPPAGTSFVVAHREPDWHEVAAQQVGGRIEMALGGVEPCDRPGVSRCRDLWVTLRVDAGVPPGTVLETRAAVTSSDPGTYPPNETSVFTSVGSAAVRRAKIFAGRPGRDRAIVQLDLARSGLRTPLDPPPPMVDVSQGVRVVFGEPGKAPLLDVSASADKIRRTNPANDPARAKTCGLRDLRTFRQLGLARLQIIQRPYLAVQRNNAQVRLQLSSLDVPVDTGHELEVTLEAAGEVYTDRFVTVDGPRGRFRQYDHHQGEP